MRLCDVILLILVMLEWFTPFPSHWFSTLIRYRLWIWLILSGWGWLSNGVWSSRLWISWIFPIWRCVICRLFDFGPFRSFLVPLPPLTSTGDGINTGTRRRCWFTFLLSFRCRLCFQNGTDVGICFRHSPWSYFWGINGCGWIITLKMEAIVPGMTFPGRWLDFLDFGSSIANWAGRSGDGRLCWVESSRETGSTDFSIR